MTGQPIRLLQRHFGRLTSFCVAASMLMLATPATALEVSVAGLKSNAGDIYICVWRQQDQGFPNCAKGAPFKKLRVSALSPVAAIPDLDPGTYAVTMFHDPLRQGRPQTNLFGMPTSAIGLANNPDVGMTNRPTFEKARVRIPETTAINIRAKYLF